MFVVAVVGGAWASVVQFRRGRLVMAVGLALAILLLVIVVLYFIAAPRND